MIRGCPSMRWRRSLPGKGNVCRGRSVISGEPSCVSSRVTRNIGVTRLLTQLGSPAPRLDNLERRSGTVEHVDGATEPEVSCVDFDLAERRIDGNPDAAQH